MREVLLLLKATRRLSDKKMKSLRYFFTGLIMFITIINVLLIFTIGDKEYSNMVVNFVNILNLSTIVVISYGYIFRNNSEKNKSDFIKFVVQIPVSKKAVNMSKFIHIWLGFIPVFIIIIVQNLACYVKALDGMSGYIGLCTILAGIQFIILSLVGGINPFLDPRKRYSKIFSFLPVLIVFLSIFITFGTIGLNNGDVYYGMLGSRFIGIFKSLELFSGMTGGVVLIVSIALGYLLSYDIPNRLFGKKGWSV